MSSIQKITPFLWFDGRAEEAADFYVSIFENSRITSTLRYDEASSQAAGRPKGSVLTVAFELEGQKFTALNGGPNFRFSPAVSFVVRCATQDEVDYYWEKLGEEGAPEAQQCGWLADKFGLFWQIVPDVLPELIGGPDSERAGRAMQAMLKMKKLDIGTLRSAYEGK